MTRLRRLLGPAVVPILAVLTAFIVGSIFAHGDHASHSWKSLTSGKTVCGGADMAADRVTRKSDGSKATMATRASTSRATPPAM